MDGYIFVCNTNTEEECLKRLLFGTNTLQVYERSFNKIKIGDFIFLYNYDTGTLKGPFRATTQCGKNIEPDAWKDHKTRGFPFQVRVAIVEEYPEFLSADEISLIVKFFSAKDFLLPQEKIDSAQVKKLLEAFQKKNNRVVPIVTKSLLNLSSMYIFKCNQTTGGKCFHDNVMGAPIGAFKNLVSHVQEGDTIFLWFLDEHKLYGVWRAKSRGQYDPSQFGPQYPAVVFCERSFPFNEGIDQIKLRGIVSYNDPYPPYQISYEQGQKIMEALMLANGAPKEFLVPTREKIGSYLADDGHWVQSKTERSIDNWLFHRGIVHAYDYRVQIGSDYLRCDFFLPQSKVYIEFWGMVGNQEYNKRRETKLDLYKRTKLKLMEIFPMDDRVLPEILSAKFGELGINVF